MNGHRRHRILSAPLLLTGAALLLLAACDRERVCHTVSGLTNITIRPNEAGRYAALNNVGGYLYLTGGNSGVIVVRTGYDSFLAYERACPSGDGDRVTISGDDWGSDVLVCPTCGSQFLTAADGMPLDGSTTPCPLFQYSTSYDGTTLYIY